MLLTSGSCTFIQKIRISKDQNYWKAFVPVYFVETTRANQSFEFLAGNSHQGREWENAFLLTHWHVRNPNFYSNGSRPPSSDSGELGERIPKSRAGDLAISLLGSLTQFFDLE